ncbi:hypothetical protein SAMN04489740_4219 [Arthrobacter alpinus]|uniref:ParB-like C-terminal domain-containing protein n=1 Tax=Arthrobacter alpinus TaxID=656366 RepID=A0A1H5PH03_9MICC|nr:hypothetical protein SAMN04489740_4219 [Arthrobacter alpinus]
MTDSVREPIGLPPRRPTPVQSLVKANRTAQPAPTTREASTPAKLERPATVAQSSGPTQATVPKGDAEAKPQQVTFYMDPTDLGRAKAAFKATGGLEGDRTWSNFIANAVLSEANKRQKKYNDGEPFKTSNEKLPPGRKV